MLSYYCGFFLKTGAFVASAMRFRDLQEIPGIGAAKNRELKLGCYRDSLEDFETTQTWHLLHKGTSSADSVNIWEEIMTFIPVLSSQRRYSQSLLVSWWSRGGLMAQLVRCNKCLVNFPIVTSSMIYLIEKRSGMLLWTDRSPTYSYLTVPVPTSADVWRESQFFVKLRFYLLHCLIYVYLYFVTFDLIVAVLQ